LAAHVNAYKDQKQRYQIRFVAAPVPALSHSAGDIYYPFTLYINWYHRYVAHRLGQAGPVFPESCFRGMLGAAGLKSGCQETWRMCIDIYYLVITSI
jgi:hypothetical protein